MSMARLRTKHEQTIVVSCDPDSVPEHTKSTTSKVERSFRFPANWAFFPSAEVGKTTGNWEVIDQAFENYGWGGVGRLKRLGASTSRAPVESWTANWCPAYIVAQPKAPSLRRA